MQQSKRQSATEVLANVMIGYWVSIGAQLVVFPLFGLTVTYQKNVGIGLCFMAVSMARGYVIRRYFNGLKPLAKPPILGRL